MSNDFPPYATQIGVPVKKIITAKRTFEFCGNNAIRSRFAIRLVRHLLFDHISEALAFSDKGLVNPTRNRHFGDRSPGFNAGWAGLRFAD